MSVHKIPAKAPGGYRMIARGNRGEIYLYGVIGDSWFGDGVSAKQFAADLKALGAVKTIDLRINSEGGDVFQGQTMYSLLTQHEAKVIVHIDGLAASAASFVAMAGNEIEIAEGAFVMIHNARGGMWGEADDLRKYADLIETVNGTIRDIYVARTKNETKKVKDWMDAETWFTGKEAVDAGFANRVVENLKVAASVSKPDQYRHLPAALRPRRALAARMIAGLTAR